jgi:hypothetical protein
MHVGSVQITAAHRLIAVHHELARTRSKQYSPLGRKPQLLQKKKHGRV